MNRYVEVFFGSRHFEFPTKVESTKCETIPEIITRSLDIISLEWIVSSIPEWSELNQRCKLVRIGVVGLV